MEATEKTVSAKSANGTNGTLAPAKCHIPLGYGTGTKARFVVTLEDAGSGPFWAPPVRRLARFLKCALRSFGLRCVDAREVQMPNGDQPATPDPATQRERTPTRQRNP
jgi:hypothetical protein